MAELYPFIDIAALNPIREGFARGDALVLVTMDFSHIIWANGAGMELLGQKSLQSTIGSPTHFNIATKRQLQALGNNHSGGPRSSNVRLATGLHSQLTKVELSQVVLPDQEIAHLLSVKAPAQQQANQLITGLASDINHVAIIDAAGQILASSPRFDHLEINQTTLADLIVEAKEAKNQLVKRRIRAGSRTVPGALLNLNHEQKINLLLVSASIEADFSGDELQRSSASQPDINEAHEQISAPDCEIAFNKDNPNIHFVWKTDNSGILTELSSSFSSALGLKNFQLNNESFEAFALSYNVEDFDEVSALLHSRDTWAGRQINWPSGDKHWMVPIELAALPAYSREREFAGFHGFGIIHCSQAEKIEYQPTETNEQLAEEPTSQMQKDDNLFATLRNAVLHETDVEPTKIEVADTPAQQDSKSARESRLSPAERNAFREIAERLRRQGIQQADEHRAAEESTYAPPVLVASNDDIDKPMSLQDENLPTASLVAEIENNITSLKEAVKQKQLVGFARQADEFLMLLPVPLVIYSSNHIHFANEAFLELAGYASIGDIEAAGGIDALFNAEDDKSGNDNSMVLMMADGEYLPVDAHLQSVPWDEGRALMISIMARRNEQTISRMSETEDHPEKIKNTALPHIEERAINDNSLAYKEEKQALQTEVDELKTILDTATDGVILINEDGSIRSMNHSASALFGYQNDEMTSKSFSHLFATEAQHIAMDYLHGLSSNGVMSVLNDGREIIGREAQGGNIPLFMTIGKLPSSSGYCAVLRDITQWKRAEEELMAARKQAELASSHKSDFLARISHEIRTPLNAIIGFSELMMDERFGTIENQRYKDYMRDINRSGNHVLALVNDLLDISKIEAGAQDMDFDAVAVNELIQETVALMQPQANRNRVIIRSSLTADLPDIVADARSIKQIILNLLSNAVKFTQAGGQVIISTAHELSGDVVIRVRDNGVGMSQQDIDVAMKPFRQVKNSKDMTTRHVSDAGTGLGLPLTVAMVEANRAQLHIESTPGRGTLIEVAFPSIRVLAD